MNKSSLIKELEKELSSLEDLELFHKDADKRRFSKDFFDYSPILSKRLEGCCADLVVRPTSIDSVLSVANACYRYSVPLTLRGSGTGNYGQSVPLEGGVVMIMNGLRRILDLDSSTGAVKVETGCLMGDLENYLLENNRQLRLLPSTWRTASIGGFVAGGSGGIGSIQWGFLRDPGNLLALEVVTVEDPPKALQLNASSSEPINHAYGTNGIITSLTLATAPAVDWHELVVDCNNWNGAVDLLKTCSSSAIELFLCSLLEEQIVDNLPRFIRETVDGHCLLLLAAPAAIDTVRSFADAKNFKFSDLGSERRFSGMRIRELAWNHTTLHMRSADPKWTYLQMLLPDPEIDAMNILKKRWKEDLLWHLEAVKQQGRQRIAALPIVRWSGPEALSHLMQDCQDAGAILFNPHVITVEDGGLGVIDSNQVTAKKNYDPKGLLNPGKLKGWL